uniref:Uncharacterized protein n=4 Tax=Rhodnius TaxID=13248 RepID=T1HWA3_RHOPR
MCIFKNLSIGGIQLVDKYVLDPESSDVLKAGISCFSFCRQQPGTFIAALESGQLMLCSTFDTNAKSSIKKSVDNSLLLRPLDKKQGLITSVKFSPYESDVYLVALLNFKISVHSIHKASAILEIFSDFDILGADWSPVQAKILIAWGSSSKLYVYNQEDGKKIKELGIENDSISNNNVYRKVIFNPKSSSLVALAGTEALTKIWKVPTVFRV